MTSKITVLGAGSWGTALALALARNHHQINLWARDPKVAEKMQASRENARYLPEISLPEKITVTSDLQGAMLNAKLVVVAIPSHPFVQCLDNLKPLLKPTTGLVIATKGMDAATGKFLDQVAQQKLGDAHPVAIISGPSFAAEVARNVPTAVTIACKNKQFADELVHYFHQPTFRVYRNTDLTGVQLCGIYKNVLAVATGIADGLECGANTRAALITRGLAELMRLMPKCGALLETAMGLAGVGDIVLTCTDNQSRNRRFGLFLGQGLTIPDAIKKIGQVVESHKNTQLICQLAEWQQVEMPIAMQVNAVLSEQQSAEQAVESLLNRAPSKD